jgi:membrane-bound ClpP family serine protease
METIAIIIILYLAGACVLIAEIFLPSHGILTVVALGLLGAGAYQTFQFGTFAGVASLVGVFVFLVAFAAVAIKYWPHTWIGRKMAPPNPVMTSEDTGNEAAMLEPLLGSVGRALTPLRPVGTCEFDGRRLPCVAEYGMIERGTEVTAVRIHGQGFAVAPATRRPSS